MEKEPKPYSAKETIPSTPSFRSPELDEEGMEKHWQNKGFEEKKRQSKEKLARELSEARGELAKKIGVSKEELERKTQEAKAQGESPLSKEEKAAWQKSHKKSWFSRIFGGK